MESLNESKRRAPRGIAYFSVLCASLLSFLLVYLPYLYFMDSDAVNYTTYFVRRFLSALISVFSAVFLFTYGSRRGFVRRVLDAFRIVLPRLAYLIPYYYVYYMSDGYDTFEALGLLTLRSLALLALYTAEALVLCAMARRTAKRRLQGAENEGFLGAALFDLAAPAVAGCFAAAFGEFILLFASEVVSTVEYAIEYAGTYRLGELYYIIGSFLFTLAALLLTHAATVGIMKLFERREKKLLTNEGAEG